MARIKGTGKNSALRAVAAWLQAGLLAMLVAQSAAAHNGPPFPIITDQRVGPCIVSLWAHPDIGTGAFYVVVDPLPGGSIPKDLKIQLGVRAWLENLRGQVEYKTEVQFDQQEYWNVRLILASSLGGGQAFSKVEATPPGFGRWDLLLYLLPFLGAGFLWFKAITKRHRGPQALAQRTH
jgi:hypothetical protein